MKYRYLILAGLLAMLLPTNLLADKKAKANKETDAYRYEIEQVKCGSSSEVMLIVYSFSKKPHIAEEQTKKNAIHACIYKGIPVGEECAEKKPLYDNANTNTEADAFLDDFFKDGGDYMRYVAVTNKAMTKTIKMKKEYKVGVYVTVQYANLRSYLEKKGIRKSLSSGF